MRRVSFWPTDFVRFKGNRSRFVLDGFRPITPTTVTVSLLHDCGGAVVVDVAGFVVLTKEVRSFCAEMTISEPAVSLNINSLKFGQWRIETLADTRHLLGRGRSPWRRHCAVSPDDPSDRPVGIAVDKSTGTSLPIRGVLMSRILLPAVPSVTQMVGAVFIHFTVAVPMGWTLISPYSLVQTSSLSQDLLPAAACAQYWVSAFKGRRYG